MSLLELFCHVDDFVLNCEPQWKAANYKMASSESVQASCAQVRR